jgi:BT1 family
LIFIAIFVYKETDSGQLDQKNIKETHILEDLKKVRDVVNHPHIRPVIILVLFIVMTPTYVSAIQYYYTEFLKFDALQMGKIAFLGSLAYLFGIFMVNTVFASASFKNFYTSTCMISGIMNGLTLILFFRLNIKLGISDSFFATGSSALTMFISEINYLPLLAFCCRLCPAGLEGTTYAIFTASLNLAWYFGSLIGSILIWAFGVNRHDFSNLWILVIIQIIYVLTFSIIVANFNFPNAEAIESSKQSRINESCNHESSINADEHNSKK